MGWPVSTPSPWRSTYLKCVEYSMFLEQFLCSHYNCTSFWTINFTILVSYFDIWCIKSYIPMSIYRQHKQHVYHSRLYKICCGGPRTASRRCISNHRGIYNHWRHAMHRLHKQTKVLFCGHISLIVLSQLHEFTIFETEIVKLANQFVYFPTGHANFVVVQMS